MAVASSGRPARAGGAVIGARAIALSAVSQNMANVLTVARLACTLPLVLLIGSDRLEGAFWVFLVAALSDVLDGYVAKRFSGCSPVGATSIRWPTRSSWPHCSRHWRSSGRRRSGLSA